MSSEGKAVKRLSKLKNKDIKFEDESQSNNINYEFQSNKVGPTLNEVAPTNIQRLIDLIAKLAQITANFNSQIADLKSEVSVLKDVHIKLTSKVEDNVSVLTKNLTFEIKDQINELKAEISALKKATREKVNISPVCNSK